MWKRNIFFLFLCFSYVCFAQNLSEGATKLLASYPDFVKGYDANFLFLKDGSRFIYDDGVKKTPELLLADADLSDIFSYTYPRGKIPLEIKKNVDPGRIRSEAFLKKMYGESMQLVQKNLVEVDWCPSLIGQKLKITKINGVDEHLKKISFELDKHPEWKEYLRAAGTFNWRIIRGSDRLSTHSFGIAIDLNVKYSNYWQWDCKCTDENTDLIYRNKIPQGIVDIFEQNGFIWGGKWYHYDTMHFEYRPELLN